MALGQTPTQTGLAAVASNMPVRNKLVADQQRAARAIQLQQAVAGLPPASQQQVGPAQVAAMAGQMAQAAGQQQVSQAQQMMKQAEGAAKLGMQEQQLAGQERLMGMAETARRENLDQVSRLAALDAKSKQELFDQEMQFARDQNNNAIFSERQLRDYALMATNREEAFRNYEQSAQMYAKRNIEMLQVMQKKVQQALESGYLDEKTRLDRETAAELAQIQKDIDNRIAKASAKAANITNAANAIGTGLQVVGAVLAFTPAAPVGIALGVAGTAVKEGGKSYAQSEAEKEAR